MKRVMTGIAVMMMVILPCQGRTISIKADGSGDYANIQSAIDDAGGGDIIELQSGVYTGEGNRDIDFMGKALIIRSVEPNDSNVVAATIIDCNGTEAEPHRGFYFHSGEDGNSVIDGLTITGGVLGSVGGEVDVSGAGICCYQSSPTIRNCVIRDNICSFDEYNNGWEILGNGGGIYCYQGSPRISKCTITNNRTSSGCGIGIYLESSGQGAVITDCNISGNGQPNFSWSSFASGAGIYCIGSAEISNCVLNNNFTWFDPGDGAAINCQGDIDIVHCTFDNNYGAGDSSDGGAICCTGDVNIIESSFYNNSAMGGGAIVGWGNIEIRDCFFSGNNSSDWGHALTCGSGVEVRNSTFLEHSGYFDVVRCFEEAVFDNCLFTGNSCREIINGASDINNCTFNNNHIWGDWMGNTILYRASSVNRCNFTDNIGLSIRECSGLVSDCYFSNNQGAAIADSNGPIKGCTIIGNSDNCNLSSAGISGVTGPIVNCIISGNRAYIYEPCYHNYMAGGIAECSGAIVNYTITDNAVYRVDGNTVSGGGIAGCTGSISNCIIWDNFAENGSQITESAIPSYSCIENWYGGGTGNIRNDPCFAANSYWIYEICGDNSAESEPGGIWIAGDYHLKSEGYRLDKESGAWTWDDVTSKCIDAGNPGTSLGDEPMTYEPQHAYGQNLRINMGAYGGTDEASIGPVGWGKLADLNNDGTVNYRDLSIWVETWLEGGEQPGDLDRNAIADLKDFALFADGWIGVVE